VSIQVQGLTKIYGDQRAIDNISFEAKEGQITGLVGPNGAGKSTTMKILTCYMPADSGQATVCGHDVVHQDLKIKSLIGYLPEHNPLYKSMYVQEYLSFIARVHGLSDIRTKVVDAVSSVGLTKEKHKKISALSKGYRQRVGIAQAIIHNPKVLILDEPISGLDPNQIQEIRDLILSLKKDKTIIFSSHILQEVESICDKIIILNEGKIVADDQLSILNENAGTETIVELELLNQMNEKYLNEIDKTMHITSNNSKNYLIKLASGRDIREDIFDAVVRQNNKILSMTMQKSNLENVFKSVTKENSN